MAEDRTAHHVLVNIQNTSAGNTTALTLMTNVPATRLATAAWRAVRARATDVDRSLLGCFFAAFASIWDPCGVNSCHRDSCAHFHHQL